MDNIILEKFWKRWDEIYKDDDYWIEISKMYKRINEITKHHHDTLADSYQLSIIIDDNLELISVG